MGAPELDESDDSDSADSEPTDDSSVDDGDDDVDESIVATKELSSGEKPTEKVTLIDLITTTIPPTTVVTTTKMMSETVKSRDSDMEMITDMMDDTNETTTAMSNEDKE